MLNCVLEVKYGDRVSELAGSLHTGKMKERFKEEEGEPGFGMRGGCEWMGEDGGVSGIGDDIKVELTLCM